MTLKISTTVVLLLLAALLAAIAFTRVVAIWEEREQDAKSDGKSEVGAHWKKLDPENVAKTKTHPHNDVGHRLTKAGYDVESTLRKGAQTLKTNAEDIGEQALQYAKSAFDNLKRVTDPEMQATKERRAMTEPFNDM